MFQNEFFEKNDFEKSAEDKTMRNYLACKALNTTANEPFHENLVLIAYEPLCDFQQFDILTSVDSDEPLLPSFKLRNSKWCSVSSLTIIEYSSD